MYIVSVPGRYNVERNNYSDKRRYFSNFSLIY